MGLQASARLIYGIELPGDISDDQVDELTDEDPRLNNAWIGTWSGGTRYLAAYSRYADPGEPQVIPESELNPVRTHYRNARLRAAWARLGRPEEMPVPGWFLGANCT